MKNAIQTVDFTNSQIMTIKNTICKDATAQEFDLFMGMAKEYGLNPFKKHLHIIIYNKDKPDKRTHAIFPSRDGWRILAGRQKDYRPADKPAEFVCSDDAKDPETNPLGIVSCGLTLYKQDPVSGNWHGVYGEAYWQEFAKVTEEWAWSAEAGKRQPTGKFELSGGWKTMPRLMIQKCAEGQALRAGWPDVFGGLHHEEEIRQPHESAMRDITPSQRVEQQAMHNRENLLGERAILMTLDDTGVFQRVPVGQMADRCLEYIKENDAEKVHVWAIQNREPLREFWTAAPNDALEVKKMIEQKTETVGRDAA